MSEQARQALSEQLDRLRQDYVAHLPLEFDTLQDLAGRLSEPTPARQDLDELHHRLHKLAGSGGTFGFAALSTAARALELQTRYWLEVGPEHIDIHTRQGFSGALSALEKTLVNGTELPDASISPTRSATPPSHASWNIWLIEDDELFGRELAYQLGSFNFKVRRFTRIDEAEAAAGSSRPDMLIVDIVLDQDRADSTETLSHYSKLITTGCPLIFITAHDDFAARVRAVRMGACGYFLKPLDIPRLIGHITQVLEKHKSPPERVLIVEDDAPLAEHYRLVLTAAGMQAERLTQPERIIEHLSALRPDLVLMDMHMPDISGPELAGVVRQHDNWASVPIVYLSAETDLDQQDQAMRRGADDFLTKPISDAQLVATVRARVKRARVLEELISRDSLTRLLKHSAIKEAAVTALARAKRTDKPLTMAMLDIDHFKKVNDSFGHAVGDVVISSVATLLRQRLRTSDIIGRYGGEEFVAVLPECSAEQALKLMGHIREHFSNLQFSSGGTHFGCTLTAGLACSEDYPTLDAEGLINAADLALYEGKNGGRNRVVVAHA